MPATKLTLRIDDAIVERAKRYSKRHHTSLSRLISAYLDSLTDQPPSVMPRVRRLTGILSDQPARSRSD